MTLKELENILPAKQFVRIHKSFIVSLKKINTLDGNTLGVGEYKLPIGKSYKSAIEEVFKLN